MNERLSQLLPPAARLSLKRLCFRAFSTGARRLPACARFTNRVSQLASAHGFDLNRVNGSRLTRGPQATDTRPDVRARENARPSVIVFDDRMPAHDRDAGSARMLFILRILAAWARPVFVSLAKDYGGAYERQLWEAGVETASAIDLPRLLRARRFDAAIISRPLVAEAVLASVRRADPRIKIVFDTVDVHFVRLTREAAATGDARAEKEAGRFRKLEARVARASDLVWLCSPEDERALRSVAEIARAAVVPTMHAPAPRGLPFDARRDLLLLGNLAHRPNSDSAIYFAREIFPLVRERLPGVRLLVVGAGAPDSVLALASPDVRVLGFVPDIEPLFAASRVMVAPLRFGAGVKGKIGEALAHGLPVVTTPVGAEGMGFDGGQVLVAEDARDFADAVTRAYNDSALWHQLSDAGRAHAAAHFAPEVVRRLVNDSLREIISTPVVSHES